MERIKFQESISIKYENGVRVSARIKDSQKGRPSPGSTARHEAAHVVAAGSIEWATIIPSGDAQGATKLKSLTAAAAAAAEAMGYDGTGHDMTLVENYLGTSRSEAISQAKGALSGKEKEMEEVATLLEEKGTIGQSDVDKAMSDVHKRKLGIHPVEIEITKPDGKSDWVVGETFRNEFELPENLLRFEPAQNPRSNHVVKQELLKAA